jgi:hypothetical protein
MRKDAVLKLLGKTGSNWSAVQRLLVLGKLREVDYQGNYFYLRTDQIIS